ncbi:hypothetical protein N7540_004101 [Penicillium herquei]|nr:hypothetical protein N7540_004101 [Penicillium herquei]
MELVMASKLVGKGELKGEQPSGSISPLDLAVFPDISNVNVEKEAGNDPSLNPPLQTENEPAGQESEVISRFLRVSPAPVENSSASPAPDASSAPTRVLRQRMAFITPESLPKEDEPVPPDQLRVLIQCAPSIRKSYSQYFSPHGHLRSDYYSLIFERNDKGELCYPDEVIASNIPQWKNRLKGFEKRQGSLKAPSVQSNAQGESEGTQDGCANEPEPKRQNAMPNQAAKRPAKRTEQRPSAEIKKKKQIDTNKSSQNTSTRNMNTPIQRRSHAPTILNTGLSRDGQAQLEAQAQVQAEGQVHAQSQREAPLDDPLFVPQPGPAPRVSETVPEGHIEDFSALFNVNGSITIENDFHGQTRESIPQPGPSVPFHVNQPNGLQLLNSDPINYQDLSRMESFLDLNSTRLLPKPPESMHPHHPDLFHPQGLMEFIRSITVQINRLNKALCDTRAWGRNLDIQSSMTRCLLRLYQLRMTCLEMDDAFRRDSMLYGK